jgi:hypothetical protein
LWSLKALNYDVSREKKIMMKIALIWIIDGFLAYGSVFG